jgi:hypothetical protein
VVSRSIVIGLVGNAVTRAGGHSILPITRAAALISDGQR